MHLQKVQATLFAGPLEAAPWTPAALKLPLPSGFSAAVGASRVGISGRTAAAITHLLLQIVCPESPRHIPALFLDHTCEKKKQQSAKVFPPVATCSHRPSCISASQAPLGNTQPDAPSQVSPWLRMHPWCRGEVAAVTLWASRRALATPRGSRAIPSFVRQPMGWYKRPGT